MAKGRYQAVRVYCKTLNKWFNSITDAANFAGAKQWTMGLKMGKCGKFIDKNGNEYTRETPLKTADNYRDTGPTLQKKFGDHQGHRKKTIHTPEQVEMQFTNPITSLKDEFLLMLEQRQQDLLKKAKIDKVFNELENLKKALKQA